jgi:hypothetical protein
VEFRNFVIDHVDRVLEYLKQNPLTIYTRRSVDAYLAGYALAAALGETVHVALVDWPPRDGVCVGFRCNGMYITEGEVGVDDSRYSGEFNSLSYYAAVIIQTLSPLEEHIHKALYVGLYAWSVDYCEYKCQFPKEMSRWDERLSVVFPFLDSLPARKALSLSTLPVVPGVTGRQVEDAKLIDSMTREEVLSLLDWALGAVFNEGFHTAILDKAVRPYSPVVKPADIAARVEADVAGFVDKEIEVYVSNFAETFYTVLKRVKEGIVPVPNSFYVYKIPPYLSYYLKLSDWVALRHETPRGSVIAVVPPLGKRAGLKKMAEALAEVGQTLQFPTHLVAYVESGKYADFLKAYEKGRE